MRVGCDRSFFSGQRFEAFRGLGGFRCLTTSHRLLIAIFLEFPLDDWRYPLFRRTQEYVALNGTTLKVG